MKLKQIFVSALLLSATASYTVAQTSDPSTTNSGGNTSSGTSDSQVNPPGSNSDGTSKMGTDNTTTAAGNSSSIGTKDNVSNSAQRFLDDVATNSMMELQLAEMAQQKASSQEVKDFGKRIQTDHAQAEQKLQALAQEASIALPTSMTKKEQRDVDKLSKLSGAEFDKEYMKMMVKDHEKSVKDYQKASEDVAEPAVKQFINQMLPTQKEHLQLAQDTEQQVSSM